MDQPLENFLIVPNVGMLEKNDWGMADLGMDSLGIRVYGSAGISFQKSLRWDFSHFSYIWPWDYAAAAIMGNSWATPF